MPDPPAAVVLVLHGGRQDSLAPTRSGQLAILRMVPIARRIGRLGRGRLAVARLRYGVRGWNGDLQSPVTDARWALDQLSARFPDLPIGLVGHSMGGRTALRVAGHDAVRSVVALAPWLPRGEPTSQLAGRNVLLVHGTADRMTSPKGSAAVAEQLREAGVSSSFIELIGERHAMLGKPRLWHDLSAGFLTATLLGDDIAVAIGGRQSERAEATNLLRRVMRGESRITV
jgi:dienelactone hydrolase